MKPDYPSHCQKKPMTRLEKAEKDLEEAIANIPSNAEFQRIRARVEAVNKINAELAVHGFVEYYVTDSNLRYFLSTTYVAAGYEVSISSIIVTIS